MIFVFTRTHYALLLQELAAKGALTESHLKGGTFSLSNIGEN